MKHRYEKLCSATLLKEAGIEGVWGLRGIGD